MVIVHPLIRVALGLAVLAGLVFALNPQEIGEYFQSVDLSNFGFAALLYTGSYLARGLRWHVLLVSLPDRRGSTWVDTAAISTLGWSLNTFLPFKLGDLVRLFLMQRSGGLGITALVSSAIVERLLDVAILLGAVATGLALTKVEAFAGIPETAFLILVVALVVMAAAYTFATKNARIPARLQRLVNEYKLAVAAYLQPWPLAAALALTVIAWALQCLQYATFFAAFGLPFEAPLFAVAFAAFMLSFAISFVPGQLGTFELFFVAIFTSIGMVRPEAALAIGIAIHAVNTLLLSSLGLVCYLKLGMPAAGIREAWERRRLAGLEA